MISILFARSDSIYKTIPGLDVWDEARDARLWPGGNPVIAHPPCRAWGRLAHMAKPPLGEKELAVFAVEQVRKWGGVLEHPENSRLWKACEMAPISHWDKWGFTMLVKQCWWGHRATKPTWLYVVGVQNIPLLPSAPPEGTHAICCDRRPGVKSVNAFKPNLPHREREATPLDFAKWLVELALQCSYLTT